MVLKYKIIIVLSTTTVTSNHDQRQTAATTSIRSTPPTVSPSTPHTLGVSNVSEHPFMPILRDLKEIILSHQQAQKTELSKMRTMLGHIQDELAKLQRMIKEESEKGASVFNLDLKLIQVVKHARLFCSQFFPSY